jgi:hypothetical protein
MFRNRPHSPGGPVAGGENVIANRSIRCPLNRSEVGAVGQLDQKEVPTSFDLVPDGKTMRRRGIADLWRRTHMNISAAPHAECIAGNRVTTTQPTACGLLITHGRV